MTVYLGVDPGASGALAAVNDRGALYWVEDMPNPLHGATIRQLLDSETIYSTAIEQVHTMPGQGVASSGKFMKNAGILEGAIGAMLIPFILVPPGTWKRAFGLIGKDKNDSRARATELWPGDASLFARKKDDGRAEAALIARWLSDTERRAVA